MLTPWKTSNFLVFLSLFVISLCDNDHCAYSRPRQLGVCVTIDDCLTEIDNIIRNSSPHECYRRNNLTYICCPLDGDKIVTNKIKINEVSNKSSVSNISVKKCAKYREERKKYSNSSEYFSDDEIEEDSSDISPVVVLGYGEKEAIQWNCSAVIISNKFLLTSSHCLNHSSLGGAKFVHIRIKDLNETENLTEIVDIKRRIPHPDYQPFSINNIGLIELKNPINFNKFIYPACLNTFDNLTSFEAATVSWDVGEYSEVPEGVEKVNLTLVSSQECNKAYKEGELRLRNGIEEDKTICASIRDAESGVCQVDLDGPLLTKNEQSGMYYATGVALFSRNCDNVYVYTKVMPYIPWIQNIVWK